MPDRGIIEQGDEVNRYHRHTHGSQGDNAKNNKKYLSVDGHKEVIIDMTIENDPKIVTDPFNKGTYNYGINPLTHFLRDVLPYWLWGNSPIDAGEEYLWDRIIGAD